MKTKRWLKENLFSSPFNCALSVISILVLTALFIPIFKWLVIDSVWLGDSNVCREAHGACLAFIREKFVFILFGMYPRDFLWRPILSVATFLIMLFYSRDLKRWETNRIRYFWLAYLAIVFWLMRGGLFGLETVESHMWGGLPLTLILSFLGIVCSYPMGIFLALGRRSELPLVKTCSVIYIELIRGVPLISLLFMASVMFPLFLPEGVVIDKLLRAQVAIIMFAAAYMAEVVRGGLQAVPKGQYEAAQALGLNYVQTMRFIILPQALRLVIPPTVNTAIGMFKDTSLVIIIALFDLMYTTKSSMTDSKWLGFSVEAYLFVAVIYFIFTFSMSTYSRRLEVELSHGHKR